MAMIDLDSDLQREVQRIAEGERRSADSVLRDAVRQYAERLDARRSFLAEAEESWADYKANGLHLTGEETRAWLRRWGGPEGVEAPDCHD